MSAFDNLKYELYAVLALTYAFPIFARSLKKGESPDWWNIEHGIGIEVTCAENRHMRYSKNFANKYLEKNKIDFLEEESKEIERFEDNVLYDESERLFAATDSKDYFDRNWRINLAIDRAKAKIEKLDSHYKKFNSNCLFIYMTQSLLDDDIDFFCLSIFRLPENIQSILITCSYCPSENCFTLILQATV